MIRRGFLAMLGLGPVAAMINKPEEASSVLQYYGNSVPSVDHSWEEDMFKSMTTDKYGWIETKKKELVCEYLRGYRNPQSIDPDIRALKSFSESAKIRLQIQREAERSYEESFADLSQRIKSRLLNG